MTSFCPPERGEPVLHIRPLGYKETRLGVLLVGLVSSDIEAVIEVPEAPLV